MKALLDIWPVLIFFVVYQLYDIYVATGAIMVAMGLQYGFLWWRYRHLSPVQVVTLLLVVVFGGATLMLRNPHFIQWKPTILQWLFAVAFFISQFVGEKPLIHRLLGTHMVLPQAVWKRLNGIWIAFFMVSGVINLFVVYTFDEATWVQFRMFGFLGMTLLFVLAQGIWLSKYMSEDTKPEE